MLQNKLRIEELMIQWKQLCLYVAGRCVHLANDQFIRAMHNNLYCYVLNGDSDQLLISLHSELISLLSIK